MPGNNDIFTIQVNEFIFQTTLEELGSSDIITRSPTEFHLIHNHRSTTGKVHECDLTGKKLRVEVDGEMFEVEIKDPLDQMLEKMGFGMPDGKHIDDIRAPMPGLVLHISVTEGQEIKQGEPVLVLEAMKMENSIVLPGDAKIKKILVKTGQTVEKGEVLVELE
ncbi:MAG TPA: acetyl-CoA carboxylase biotin carboxyl carrier protein subunit [Parafilimonas sp.]|nr:acetyl-CoA carboxylase biotin carboxyl carrier protein subunit [Parafilimonas sp.]